jgi:hypothetical protein
MQVNIVTNFQILQEIKKSIYFQVNLGFIPTVEKNGQRVFNDQDKFSQVYNGNYKTTIYAQGKIGNIRFYTDHYIQDPIMGVYYGDTFEEFVVDFDNKLLREKSIDGYLGYIIKTVEEQYDEKVKANELRKVEEKPKGNSSNILNNPGNVNYEDLKEYLKNKNKERYS